MTGLSLPAATATTTRAGQRATAGRDSFRPRRAGKEPVVTTPLRLRLAEVPS